MNALRAVNVDRAKKELVEAWQAGIDSSSIGLTLLVIWVILVFVRTLYLKRIRFEFW